MAADYLVCYDVSNAKRRRKVAKIVYSVALGGQKSALHSVLSSTEAEHIAQEIFVKIKPTEDRVNLIKVAAKPMLLGCAQQLHYNNAVIVI